MIVASADWHLTDNPRDQYRHDFQKQLRAILKTRNIRVEAVVMLGDMVDAKDRHSSWLVNQVVDYIYQLSLIVPVYALKGNHDYTDPDLPFWQFLRRLNNVHYITRPTKIRVPGIKGPCLFLPHTHDYKAEWGTKKIDYYSYVFAHNTFKGANLGNRIAVDGIPLDIFGADQRVVSGDVHIPQWLNGNFQYVGAPYRINYGDQYEPQVLALDEGCTIPLEVSGPQKHLLELPCKKLPKLLAGDMVKIRVKIKMNELADWPSIKRDWHEWAANKQLIVHKVEPVIDRPALRNNLRVVAGKDFVSDEELIDRLCHSQKVDDATYNVGLKITREE